MRYHQVIREEPGVIHHREAEVENGSVGNTRAVPGSGHTRGGSRMGSQLELVRCFQEQLAAYKAYCDISPDGSEVVPVSFQCMIGGGSDELGEVLGVVAL
jgi:hypothetical protein